MRGSRLAVAVLAMAASGPSAGCGSSPIPCTVDLQVARDVGTMDVLDIGSFSLGDVNYTDEAMLAAQQQVLSAIANHRSFKLIYDARSSTGELAPGLRAAFVGTLRGATVSLRTYAGKGLGDMSSGEDLVSNQACQSVEGIDPKTCTPKVGMPCLTCVPGPDDVGSVTCRGS